MGAFLPWFDGDEARPTVTNFEESVAYFGQFSPNDPPDYPQLVWASEPFLRAAFLAMSALMLFGLTGTSGKLTRVMALLVVAMMASIVAYSILVDAGGLVVGSFVVVLGGIIGSTGSRRPAGRSRWRRMRTRTRRRCRTARRSKLLR